MTEASDVGTEANGQETKQANNEQETELESAIIRQVEYYFGDINLCRDKFLQQQIKLDEGWVPLEILLRFNRLAKLSKDAEVIVNALNKSSSGLLEISEDKLKVRRSPEMPLPEMNEERRKEITSRTVYVKGFPKNAVLDDLLKHFKQYEEVENLIMRKYLVRAENERRFKGSVFVTFKTKDQAEKFIQLKDLKYGKTELITLWQENYLVKKQEEYAVNKEKRSKDKTPAAKEEKDEFKLPTGTVLHFGKGPEKMTRENIKEALTALDAEVAYIDFKSGDPEGWVRLTKENSAKEFAEKLTEGKVKIGDTDVEFRLLEDEEEKTYLAKTIEEMSKRRKNQKHFNKNNKGRNNKRQGGGKKRKQDSHADGPPAKVKADS